MDKIQMNNENPIICREMTMEDLKNASAVFCETFASSPWNEPWTFEKAFKRIDQMIRFPGQKSYVAVQDEKVLAFCVGTV